MKQFLIQCSDDKVKDIIKMLQNRRVEIAEIEGVLLSIKPIKPTKYVKTNNRNSASR